MEKEITTAELELVLDEIVELTERLFSVMEALRENKEEVKAMQLYIMYFNDIFEELKEKCRIVLEGYLDIYYDKKFL